MIVFGVVLFALLVLGGAAAWTRRGTFPNALNHPDRGEWEQGVFVRALIVLVLILIALRLIGVEIDVD